LPEYLVPHGLVILETLPLTPTGKIDRRALPDPLDLAQRTKPQSPPDTLIEFLLAEIWKRLLELRHVDVRESFFDLGGHSLLAAKMIEEIERVCGVRIPVTTLFTSATIAELAAVLRAGVPTQDPLVALNARGLRPPLFFLHGDFIEGGLYCRGLAAALGADQPFWAVHPHGLDRGALPASIEAMAADRVAAIQREHPRGPYFLGGHCNGALVAVEIARQLMEAGEQVPAVVVLDCAARNSYAELRTVASSDGESDRHGEARIARSGDRQVAAIDEHYRRAMQQYVPEPFPGRIAVLRSLKYRRADPDLGWAAFARQIETHRIPGGHLSSVTRHIATTAACISGCLNAAYGQGSA
jgi:thioesterase domain-containing protein/acyl carrier protein